MLEIRSRSRVLPVQIIDGTSFPGLVYFDPIEVPIFKLTITNYLKFGDSIIYYGDIPSEIVLWHDSFTIDLQKCHSYSEQNILFPKGFLVGIDNEEDFNLGAVFMTAYTYYWEV